MKNKITYLIIYSTIFLLIVYIGFNFLSLIKDYSSENTDKYNIDCLAEITKGVCVNSGWEVSLRYEFPVYSCSPPIDYYKYSERVFFNKGELTQCQN